MDLKRAMFIQDDGLFFIPQNIVLQPTLPPALIVMDVKCLRQFHDETFLVNASLSSQTSSSMFI